MFSDRLQLVTSNRGMYCLDAAASESNEFSIYYKNVFVFLEVREGVSEGESE